MLTKPLDRRNNDLCSGHIRVADNVQVFDWIILGEFYSYWTRGCQPGGRRRGYDKTKMRRTVNANSTGLRATPRSLLVHNLHTSTMITFTPLCKPKPLIKFSGHPTTMHILNQYTSYTPPRTTVWCVSEVERGIRSGGLCIEALRPLRI